MTLEAVTKISIYTDSETNLKKHHESAIFQVAPQTKIKNIAFVASMENVPVILDEINKICKIPGQRRYDNTTQLDRYFIQQMLGKPTTLTAGTALTIVTSERQGSPNNNSRQNPGQHIRHTDMSLQTRSDSKTRQSREPWKHARWQRKQKQHKTGEIPNYHIEDLRTGKIPCRNPQRSSFTRDKASNKCGENV